MTYTKGRLVIAMAFAAAGVIALMPIGRASSITTAPGYSDWTVPVNLGPVVNSVSNDMAPALSKDGLSLYFQSNRPIGGSGGPDLWVSQRTDTEAPWGPPINLGAAINSSFTEGSPVFSRDGHWLFFNSDRPGGVGGTDIWVSWREQTHDDFGWQTPVNLGAPVNSASGDSVGSYFENEDAGGPPLLFFSSNRPLTGAAPGGPYVSEILGNGSFGPAMVITELDSPQDEMRPTIRFDGRELFLSSSRPGGGAFGLRDFWVSTRETVFDLWSPPENAGFSLNTASNELTPSLSADGLSLLCASDRLDPDRVGLLDLYVATRTRGSGQSK